MPIRLQAKTEFHFNVIFALLQVSMIILEVQSQAGTTTHTLASGTRGNTHTLSLSGFGNTDLISVKLDITSGNPLSTTAMIVSLDNLIAPSSIDYSNFYHENPRDVDVADIDSMWNARDQYINIHRNSQPNIFITVFNFDPSYRQSNIGYSLTLQSAGQTVYTCEPCQNGGSYPSSTNCFCRNCLYQNTGKVCTRLIINMDKNSTSLALTPYAYNYFSITNTDKITVQINIQGGIAQAYFQFEQFENQVASFYNVAKGTSDGRYLINNNGLKLGADTQQRKLLITLVNFSPVPINASISYTVQNTVSVLVIVMSVLGGILLIALIVAIVCIVKRRNSASRVSSQANLPSQTNKLSSQQIQRYFPLCPFSQLGMGMSQSGLGTNPESSMNPIQADQKQQKVSDQDCVICLQLINPTDPIRLAYCKHMFHGQCLISWFKKQRNCPYCRKQYTRDETVNEYNRIVAENGNRVLKDNDLVKAIYNRKLTASKTVIQNLQ